MVVAFATGRRLQWKAGSSFVASFVSKKSLTVGLSWKFFFFQELFGLALVCWQPGSLSTLVARADLDSSSPVLGSPPQQVVPML